MINSKTSDYELIVLGNDPQVAAFLRQAGRMFSRVLWIRDPAQCSKPIQETGSAANTVDALSKSQLNSVPAIEILEGRHQFVSEVAVQCELTNGVVQVFTAERFVLAYGARPDRPNWLITHPRVILHNGHPDSADLAELSAADTVAIVGMGDRGQACLRQLRGKVRHIYCLDAREIEASLPLWRSAGGKELTFHARTSVIGMRTDVPEVQGQTASPANRSADNPTRVTVFLENGATLSVSAVVICCGTRGNTEQRGLEFAGLTVDDRGKLWCNESGETWTSGIFALGEVVGYPHHNLAHASYDFHRQLLEALSTQPAANCA